MAEMKIDELWRYFRSAENAFRYYADIILGVIRETGRDFKIKGIDPDKLDDLKGKWPNNPICLPPGPCFVQFPHVLANLEDLQDKLNSIRHIMEKLAEQQPVGEITYHPSEMPGAGRGWGDQDPIT